MLSSRQAEEIFKSVRGREIQDPVQVSSLSGGDIAKAYRIQAGEDCFFLKTLPIQELPKLFVREAEGLTLLAESASTRVARPLKTEELDSLQYLALDYIESATPTSEYWQQFAIGLASIHAKTQSQFGLATDNYIGSIVQKNTLRSSWSEFYFLQRLEPLMRQAMDEGLFPSGSSHRLERFAFLLEQLVPREKPSLIHGDLWSGNLMSDEKGEPLLIDPAVYFGHREMDLAMTTLFGSFPEAFYSEYQQSLPLEKNWEERLSIHQVYPLLVHTLLFGGHYANQVLTILRRFGA